MYEEDRQHLKETLVCGAIRHSHVQSMGLECSPSAEEGWEFATVSGFQVFEQPNDQRCIHAAPH